MTHPPVVSAASQDTLVAGSHSKPFTSVIDRAHDFAIATREPPYMNTDKVTDCSKGNVT